MNPSALEIVKRVATEYAEKVWDEQDLSVIDRLLHPQIVIHSPLGDSRGPEAMRRVVQTWLTAFPDLVVTNAAIIAESDTVVIRFTATGTHRGDFRGRKPTGRQVAYSGVSIYRINAGQIIEYWAFLDLQQLLSQIT